MDYLRRGAAPLSARVWQALDEAVAQAARHVLAARRVATFDGPRGWEHVAVRLGSMTPCAATMRNRKTFIKSARLHPSLAALGTAARVMRRD